MLYNVSLYSWGSKRATGVKLLIRPPFYDAVIGRKMRFRGEIHGSPVTVEGMGKEFEAIPIGTL